MADTDFRALVESAYNEAEANGASDGESATSEADVAMGDSGVAQTAPGVAEASGDDGGSGESAALKAATERARDASGKFAPKSKAQETLKPAAPKSGGVAEGVSGGPPTAEGPQFSAQPAEALKAPQGLTPQEREVFAKAPPEIQKALARLDQTARQSLQEAAPAKRFHQEAQQAFAPYEQMLRQSGFRSPIEAAQNAFGTIQQLQSSNPEQVAAVLSQLAHTYGVKRFGRGFVEQFAGVFDAGPQQQQQQPTYMDPEAIARQAEERVFQRLAAQRQEQGTARARQEVEAFASDPANDFFQDVWPEMAVIIDAAKARNGAHISLKDAYERAIWADPGTRDIMQKRAAQQAAKATQASTQQARLAASSVKSAPSTGASSMRAPKTPREMVEAAYDSLDQ